MREALEYISDMIESAYNDGWDRLPFGTSGRFDPVKLDWLLSTQRDEEPSATPATPAEETLKIGAAVRLQVPAFTGAPCVGTIEAIDHMNQFPYFVRIDRYRGVWRGAYELELA